MKATVSLKSLRTNPRGFVNLLNQGYEVAITEHRRELVSAKTPPGASPAQRGNVAEILKVVESLPKIKVLDPKLDTVSAFKKAKTEYLENKNRRALK